MKFSEIELNLSDNVVILDVDGTLVSDKNTEISQDIIKKIDLLKSNNEVFIGSNGSPENAKKFADLLGVNYFKCFKPFRGDILQNIGAGKDVVVIGDKYLTDGLFALNIGADFIKVEHIKSESDSFFIRFTYFLDDFVWKLKNYLFLIRSWHWVKNLLVFSPVFFASVHNGSIILNAFWAFVIFSIFSSATYVFNDIVDLESDKLHPIKKKRPLASGLVSLKESYFIFIILLVLGVFGLVKMPIIFPILISYLFLNLLYSVFLKNIPVIESVSVALSYVLRVIAGGLATGVYISPWIIICVFFGSLFVIFGKRKGEFSRENKRKVLQSYSEKTVDIFFAFSGVSAIILYSIWSVLGHHSEYLFYSVIFVVVAILRMISLIYDGNKLSENPEYLVFSDKIVLLSFLCWLVYVSFIFYL